MIDPEICQDDWCQGLKENPPDPEEIRQLHEAFLNDLEALAVQALASRDWSQVYAHIATIADTKTNLSECFNSQEEYDKTIAFINRLLGEDASADEVDNPSAGLLLQPTEQTAT